MLVSNVAVRKNWETWSEQVRWILERAIRVSRRGVKVFFCARLFLKMKSSVIAPGDGVPGNPAVGTGASYRARSTWVAAWAADPIRTVPSNEPMATISARLICRYNTRLRLEDRQDTGEHRLDEKR